MAKKPPKYCYQYYIDVNDLKISLNEYLEKIKEINELYRTNVDSDLKEDIIDHELKKKKSGQQLIILKLRSPYGMWREEYLFKLLRKNCINTWLDVKVTLY